MSMPPELSREDKQGGCHQYDNDKYVATPHGNAKRKEYEVTPHGNTKRNDAQVMYGATPHGKADHT